MIRKVFAYVVRDVIPGLNQLLIFTDHHGRMSVPKGTVEAGESLHDAVVRELHEESGIAHAQVLRPIGERMVEVHGGPAMQGPLEQQLHVGFLIRTSDELPDRWSHVVHGDGIDNGFVYHYEWLELTSDLPRTLAYGAGWFARELFAPAR